MRFWELKAKIALLQEQGIEDNALVRFDLSVEVPVIYENSGCQASFTDSIPHDDELLAIEASGTNEVVLR